MSKYKLLGFLNILLGIFFAFVLATSGFDKQSFSSFETFVGDYASKAVFLFLLILNIFLAHKLLFKKEYKFPFSVYLTITLSTVLWFLLLFIGFFFASNVIFPIVSLALSFSLFYFFRKKSKKIAIVLALVTLLVSLIVVVTSFEEDFCWKKGEEADRTGHQMITATKEDEEKLNDYDVKEGAQIGISFRTHMLCHNTFSLTEALKEKY